MSFFEAAKNGFYIRIKLTPNAATCGFGGSFLYTDDSTYLKASVTTQPEKGKANKEIIRMLSKELNIPKQNIELISGATTHFKRFFVAQTLTPQLTEKLNSLIKGKKDDR